MTISRKYPLSEKKKQILAAMLANKIGYLRINDVVPSGILESLSVQSFNPHRIISCKDKLFLIREG